MSVEEAKRVAVSIMDLFTPENVIVRPKKHVDRISEGVETLWAGHHEATGKAPDEYYVVQCFEHDQADDLDWSYGEAASSLIKAVERYKNSL